MIVKGPLSLITAMKRRPSHVVLGVTGLLLVLFYLSFSALPVLRGQEPQAGATPQLVSDEDVRDTSPSRTAPELPDVGRDDKPQKEGVEILLDIDDEDELKDEEEAGKALAKAYTSREDRTCFLYDRPPRTGSTTVSKALKSCLRSRFVEPDNGPRSLRPYHVSNMMKLDKQMVGVYARHLSLNRSDIESLRKGCETLMYVTSIKPLKDRLWSYSKHRLTRVDRSMTDEKMQDAIAYLSKPGAKVAEEYLEAYPYVGPEDEKLNIAEADKLIPDYVIRSEIMAEDLGKLLQALACESHFESKNTRGTDSSSEAFLDDVELKYGDRTYLRLKKLAELSNAKGLEKARSLR